ncbi:MAG TPA: hypothetical protein VHS06_03945, partial [Chloroflexota bacterium]|nr:hypothetical protein [Chloroflexota bacterium]
MRADGMRGVLSEKARTWLLLQGFALALLTAACIPSSPTYPFDIFPEMHYSPAVRQEEPPRLSVPPGAVPVTGA